MDAKNQTRQAPLRYFFAGLTFSHGINNSYLFFYTYNEPPIAAVNMNNNLISPFIELRGKFILIG